MSRGLNIKFIKVSAYKMGHRVVKRLQDGHRVVKSLQDGHRVVESLQDGS